MVLGYRYNPVKAQTCLKPQPPTLSHCLHPASRPHCGVLQILGCAGLTAREFIAVQDAEVGEAQGQLAVRARAGAEYEAMARAVHRLEPELCLLDVQQKHVLLQVETTLAGMALFWARYGSITTATCSSTHCDFGLLYCPYLDVKFYPAPSQGVEPYRTTFTMSFSKNLQRTICKAAVPYISCVTSTIQPSRAAT